MHFVSVTQSHTIYLNISMVVTSFKYDLVQCASIGTSIINSLALSIRVFLVFFILFSRSLYESQ